MSHSFWYTDKDTIDDVKSVLGEIDLDPCTSEKANRSIGATHIFTVENSCLDNKWPRVKTSFMNPPYSHDCGTSQPYVQKFINEFLNGCFQHGIVLVNASPSSEWFQMLVKHCSAVCFPSSRIRFDEDIEAVWENKYAKIEHDYLLDDKALAIRYMLKQGITIDKGNSPRYDNAIFLFNTGSYVVQNKFYEVFNKRGVIMMPTHYVSLPLPLISD